MMFVQLSGEKNLKSFSYKIVSLDDCKTPLDDREKVQPQELL